MFYNIIFGAYDSVAPPSAPNTADRTAIATWIIFFHIIHILSDWVGGLVECKRDNRSAVNNYVSEVRGITRAEL